MFVCKNEDMHSLSVPVPRRLIHTREIRTRGFLRDDGLWDVEGELMDEKSYTYADRERGLLPADPPCITCVHGLPWTMN